MSTIDLERLPDAVICVDAHGVIVEANPAAARLTGFPVQDLVGTNLAERLDPRARDGALLLERGWHRSAGLASVTRIPEQEVTIRRPDGTTLRVFVTGHYDRDGNGSVSGAVLMLRDMARRANVAASGIEIVSTVSHELRSPLTSVKGYTSLLLNRWDRLDDEQKKMMLAQVHHDADRVTRLVTELLDISRLETGRLVLRREMIDITTLATSVIEKVGMEYPDLACQTDFPDAFPPVYADPDKVEQVLTNLVENAVKYGSPTGMRILGETTDHHVRIAVQDVGAGIPERDLPRVFTKFFRRDQGRPTGSGLGLWISRGLVEAHGGELVASSILGEGTTFSFTLPSHMFEDIHDSTSA